MVYLFVTFAVGLAIAAYVAEGRGTRIFLVACAVLNLAGAAKAFLENDPYAHRLRPNDGTYEPALRR